MNRMCRLWSMHASLGAIAALGLAFCHAPDQPPIPPPKPTDPTSLAARDPAEDVTDASIVTDGGAGWDGSKFELDTGASSGRPASP
jgi:hypothetical protein